MNHNNMITRMGAAFVFVLLLCGAFFEWRLLHMQNQAAHNLARAERQIESQFEARLSQAKDSLQGQFMLTAYTVKPTDTVMFADILLPLQRVVVREEFERQLLLVLGRRDVLLIWYLRMGRYFPLIDSVLNARKLPSDLKYLFVWESSLDPRATSWKQARGIAQIMPVTGRNDLGMIITDMLDERLDPNVAVVKACDYLERYSPDFKHWLKVLASYNGGANQLQGRFARYDHDDIYTVPLPKEMHQFFYVIPAVAHIFKHPKVYLPTYHKVIQYKGYLSQRISHRVLKKTNLYALAKELKVDYDLLIVLNPHLSYELVPGRYRIYRPRV